MAELNADAKMATYTIFFDQSAHLDWDWIRSFPQNYWYYSNGTGADAIIRSGIDAAADQTNYPGYSYTVCEMAFLRQFVNANPTYAQKMSDLSRMRDGERFQVIGAGMTSPDCLVTSAEGFIRNYLVGQVWVKSALNMDPKPYCWIPDDFGQGPELPVLLSALGFENVVIARTPQIPTEFENVVTAETPDFSNDGSQVFKDGFDIKWQASDGSTIPLHWTGALYNQSPGLQGMKKGKDFDLKPINDLINLYRPNIPFNGPDTKYAGLGCHKYMYWPIMDDFSTIEIPTPDLSQAFSVWNDPDPSNPYNAEHNASYNAKATNVKVEWGTFDRFHRLIMECEKKPPTKLLTKSYNGTPLWTGFFASRPKLKALHYQTVRALVAAEVFGLLTQPSNRKIRSLLPVDFWTRIDQVWLDFAPSTHHDFVTGTSPDEIYTVEQLPILVGTAAAAKSLKAAALCALAGALSPLADDLSIGILVANSLGFTRSGLAHIEDVECFANVVRWGDASQSDQSQLYSKTQRMSDGSMTVYVPEVGSFGYIVGHALLSVSPDATHRLEPSQKVTLLMTDDGGTEYHLTTFEDVYNNHFGEAKSFTITNQALQVTISERCGWGIESIKDSVSGKDILRHGAIGNDIDFYNEYKAGDIYHFGSEDKSALPNWTKRAVDNRFTQGPGLGAAVTEVGELVIAIRTEVIYNFKANEFEAAGKPAGSYVARKFTREYELRAGEPFLRMSTSGSAPPETAVVVTFPFEHRLDGIDHGTGYHWTHAQPYPGNFAEGAPIFRPTHDFLQPFTETQLSVGEGSERKYWSTLYHEAMPAWAIASDAEGTGQNQKVLMGCLYRNSTIRSARSGANGTDVSAHTHRYAIRTNSGLEGPHTGQPYRGAQSFHTSLQAVRLLRGTETPCPGLLRDAAASLAEADLEGGTAMLTVAKPGSYDKSRLILRIYQADNKLATKNIRVSLPLEPTDVKMITALETEWKGDGSAAVTKGQKEIIVTPSGCVSTISIAGLGR